jgi:hypothetical protein
MITKKRSKAITPTWLQLLASHQKRCSNSARRPQTQNSKPRDLRANVYDSPFSLAPTSQRAQTGTMRARAAADRQRTIRARITTKQATPRREGITHSRPVAALDIPGIGPVLCATLLAELPELRW